MKKQNVRTLALIVGTVTYLLIGAAIFDLLESAHEHQERVELNNTENAIRQYYNMSTEDFELLRRTILKAKPYKAGIQWKFAGAFYFALSVITTIGYGHTTPRTLKGKMFCIGYALIGIPLNIVMFQSIGERFNIGVTFLLRKVKKCFKCCKNSEVTQTELTVLGMLLCLCVVVGGAASFHHFENWKFLDAFYYCFITMSTIGFGDFVALQNEDDAALQTQPEYVAFCIIYILFGLTVFAAALNLMVLKLLTMNTEDERKDELEALAAARGAPKLDGDVIRPNHNGHLPSQTDVEEGYQLDLNGPTSKQSLTHSITYTPSISSALNKRQSLDDIPKTKKLKNKFTKIRYSVKPKPTSIQHLLPMQNSNYHITNNPLDEVTEMLPEESPVESERTSPTHVPLILDSGSIVPDDDDAATLLQFLNSKNRKKRYSC